MALTRWVLLVSVLASTPLFGGTGASGALSPYQAQLDLLGPVSSAARSATPLLQEAMPARTRKSVGLAALYSLLLPGMGELYAGSFGSGKYFLAAEGALWLTYGAFDLYGNSLRDDARVFAQMHAGLQPSGKDDQFFVDVGNFLDVDLYNDKKLRDRDLEKVYDPAAGYGWRWDSETSRLTFRDRRVASENMYNNRKFVLAAVLINHVASAINAARAAIANNKETDAMGELQLGARVLGGWEQPHGLMLTVSKPF